MSGWSSGHDSVLAVNSLVEFALQEQVSNTEENQENTKRKTKKLIKKIKLTEPNFSLKLSFL